MFDIREELKKLPDKPGVYIMKDKAGVIIYVGKAAVLKNRVRQYFQDPARLGPKIRSMVGRIESFEYFVAASELEALILECNLIKKHKPRYNFLLKDDKTYPYIKVTLNEEYPRIQIVRRLEKDGSKYFGPYSGVNNIREALDFLRTIFPMKSCSRILPRDTGKGRPCLNYHIYRCPGPCIGGVGAQEYREVMKDICSFLNGRQEEILKKLEKEMVEASADLKFEKAAVIRDRIKNLKYVAEKQNVLTTDGKDRDVISFARGNTDLCIQLFFVRNGRLTGKEHVVTEGGVCSGTGDSAVTDDPEILVSFIKQFYDNVLYIPDEILLPQNEGLRGEAAILEKWLTFKKGSGVAVSFPARGARRKLVEMATSHAEMSLRQFEEKAAGEAGQIKSGMDFLSALPGVPGNPVRIEAYDVSNTGVTEITGSMAVFIYGKPAKGEYRKFKIKTLDRQDDYAGMKEIIRRRFKRAGYEMKGETQKDAVALKPGAQEPAAQGPMTQGPAAQEPVVRQEVSAVLGFDAMPSLILIDGGKGHAAAAFETLKEIGLAVPVFGLVKNDAHRTRGIMSPDGTEYSTEGDIKALRFITSIQDEAHRFALQYNLKLRDRRYVRSELDEIDGIGPKKKKALIKHFGSVGAVSGAEIDDLEAVIGISRRDAEKIHRYFKGGEGGDKGASGKDSPDKA